VWHHPLIALVPQSFLVVDRLGDGANLDERPFDVHVEVVLPDVLTG
jgi:ureidoglycolate hydrolase